MEKKVISIGGGSGTFPVIKTLLKTDASVNCIICVSDSGGSTGKLRDEFGFQPVGDLRQALAALSSDREEGKWVSRLLQYRFDKGTGLVGHNLGNLILTALQDMTKDTNEALAVAKKIFGINGWVVPVTNENVHLKIHYVDGTSVVGEHILDESDENPKKIESISFEPEAKINPIAEQKLKDADFVVIGPGDYYGSIMSVLAVDGVKEAFKNSSAKIVYILNLMSRRTQTHDMTAQEHIDGIEKIIGKKIDYCIVNNQPIPQEALDLYKRENEFPILDNLGDTKEIIRAELLDKNILVKNQNDSAYRSLLRHDSDKLLEVFRMIGL